MNKKPESDFPATEATPGGARPQFSATTEPGTPAAAILTAARTLFAAQGFAGTSTRSIAEAASVNLAMIHYYFGNKEKLYRQVMEQELGELLQSMRENLQEDLCPRELLSALPAFILNVHHQRPGLIQLMLREMNDGAPTLPGLVQAMGEHGPLGVRQKLYGLIDDLQGAGFAADLPPSHLLAFFFGLSHGMMAFAPLIQVITDLDLHDADTATELGNSAATFVRRALAPIKETS